MLPAEFPVPLAESPGLALVLLAVSLVPLAESLGLALVLLAVSLVLLAVSLVPLAGSLVLPAGLPESVPGLHILQGWS